MKDEVFKKITKKYAEGQELSPEEEAQARQAYDQLLEEELAITGENPSFSPDEKLGIALRQKIDQRIGIRRIKHFSFNRFAGIAAVLLLGVTLFAGLFWLWTGKTEQSVQLAKQKDILPGENKALLTLADGSVISLKDARNGTVATQNGVLIEKDDVGNIRYIADGKPDAGALEMNTIATPKGGQYRITLPDGSIAMLNAASSLSYPVHFDEKERRVKMTGEVYFEIAKVTDNRKKRIPFFVDTDRQSIQVLGTHFNVNAYENALRTTLVEGSVKIEAHNGKSTFLKPGEQAILAKELKVQEVDIKEELAWIHGDFIFRSETLESVFGQLERWYDIEVEYPPEIGKLRFNGMISRSQPLSSIVKMIQSTKKANVTIKERRIIVTL